MTDILLVSFLLGFLSIVTVEKLVWMSLGSGGRATYDQHSVGISYCTRQSNYSILSPFNRSSANSTCSTSCVYESEHALLRLDNKYKVKNGFDIIFYIHLNEQQINASLF